MSTVQDGPGEGAPTPVMPAPLRPMSRRSQRQVTLGIAALLVLLIGIRLLSTHPLPKPSHSSPAAAVAGYVGGLSDRHLTEVQSYLAPAQRSQAAPILKAMERYQTTLQAPSLAEVTEDGDRATVAISLQVCYQTGGKGSYNCEPIGHAPLGLPSEIKCQRLGGSWYVTTLFKPS